MLKQIYSDIAIETGNNISFFGNIADDTEIQKANKKFFDHCVFEAIVVIVLRRTTTGIEQLVVVENIRFFI